MKLPRILPLALLIAACVANAQQVAPRFDVVTVKRSDPAKEHLALYWRRPDGLKWDGVTVRGMIANAFGVSSIVKDQIEGGPDWMDSRAFNINAKVDDETTARWSKMTQPEVDEERRRLTQSLLTDRFQLKFHHETREMPALVLRIAKGGSKLQIPRPEHDLEAGTPHSRINFFGEGNMEGHSALMSNLIRSLAAEPEIAGRPVVDKTGLTGGYDFTLRWTSDDPGSRAAATDTNTQWPSLFTALEEQLGLRLTSEKQPIDVIVVDSVEMPSEN
ncbi:TIGR03435 family protein [Silvibacterium sp.]|uniref:TIGR03435 family protein n=1 Tax=Silvibacterium sp. TaxID=1964179 RepID=UPI0039E49415